MGEVVQKDWPVLDDMTEYLVVVEVYIYPDGEYCRGSYDRNEQCIRFGATIKHFLNTGLECTCEQGLCPHEGPCAAQRLVSVMGM